MRTTRAIIIAALVFCCLQSTVEAVKVSKLTGFQTLKWGESTALVTSKLRKKYTFRRLSSGLPYFTGEFGGYRDCSVFTYFKDNRLYKVRITLAAQDGKNTADVWGDLVDKLTAVYGEKTGGGFAPFDGESTRYSLADAMNLESDTKDELARNILSAKYYAWMLWGFPDGNEIYMQTVREDDVPGSNLYISLNYSSPKEEERANKGTLKDF